MTSCAAIGCAIKIPTKYLMCGRHWHMVSTPLQDAVYHYYRKGQESGRVPITANYRAAARRAIEYVAGLEGKQQLLLTEAIQP